MSRFFPGRVRLCPGRRNNLNKNFIITSITKCTTAAAEAPGPKHRDDTMTVIMNDRKSFHEWTEWMNGKVFKVQVRVTLLFEKTVELWLASEQSWWLWKRVDSEKGESWWCQPELQKWAASMWKNLSERYHCGTHWEPGLGKRLASAVSLSNLPSSSVHYIARCRSHCDKFSPRQTARLPELIDVWLDHWIQYYNTPAYFMCSICCVLISRVEFLGPVTRNSIC